MGEKITVCIIKDLSRGQKIILISKNLIMGTALLL